MNFEKALEFAVISSWEELVKPGEHCSIHVEYQDKPGTAVDTLQVWSITNKGHGSLVCDYSQHASGTPSSPATQFANSYASQSLVQALDFVMQNQRQFTRTADHDVHGLVQVGIPSKEDRAKSAEWWHAMMTELVRTAPPSYRQPELELGTFIEKKSQSN